MTTAPRERPTPRWRRTPVLVIASFLAGGIAVVGLLFSRADVVVMALPFAIWTALVFRRPAERPEVSFAFTASDGGDGTHVEGALVVDSSAEWVQLALDQGVHRRGYADVSGSATTIRTRNTLFHSGPAEILAVAARTIAADGAWASTAIVREPWNWHAIPRTVPLGALPLAPRLRGQNGAHTGNRPGQGGEFRDIHPFAPGDELRRVDWKATARRGRFPGDLLVRRTTSLSEAAVVIAVDTADDIGEKVAAWGVFDPERSGVTSLDHARTAALALATAAIRDGDRVSYHELAPTGRTLRGGTGPRHLARLRDAIAATGVSEDTGRFRRTPPVPQGAVVFLLSTFFDGVAGQIGADWQAAGHRVIAVDVLPRLDAARLSPAQRTAMRTLLAERDGVLADLRRAGADVLSWSDGGARADTALRILTRTRP